MSRTITVYTFPAVGKLLSLTKNIPKQKKQAIAELQSKIVGSSSLYKKRVCWLVPCPRHRLIPVGCPVQVMHRLGPEGMTESALEVDPLAC